MNIQDKFWSLVQKTDSCWIWLGRLSPSGNCLFPLKGKIVIAQRFAWEIERGTSPTSMLSCVCGNRLCVNPEHYVDNTLERRFWSKIKIGSNDECWEWTGWREKNHYGLFALSSYKGKQVRVPPHRAMWLFTYGDIPDGLYVCHSCDNKGCVNPNHLFLGTPKDNMQDMINKGRRVIKYGTERKSTKLNDESVREIRSLIEAGELSHKEIADKFGISRRTVGNILHKDSWAWLE